MSRAKTLEEKLWRELERGVAGVENDSAKLTLDKVNRYSAHHTRIYFRAIRELRKQQALRQPAGFARQQFNFERACEGRPYNRKVHGIMPPLDGFVSSESLYYQVFDNLLKGTAAQIVERRAAADASPVAPAA
jgi:hypothetical protein